jgi:hypothetical protein
VSFISPARNFAFPWAKVVELRYFSGLSIDGDGGNSGRLERDRVRFNWNMVKAWLKQEITK